MRDGEELMTTAQAAMILGVSPRQIRFLIFSGRLPAIRMGPVWMIRKENLYLPRVQVRPVGRPPGGGVPTEYEYEYVYE